MTRILAIDQATQTGWTFGGSNLDLADWPSGHFRAPKRPEEGERLIIIEDSLLELIDKYDPDVLVYEEPYDPTWDAVAAAKKGKQPRSGYNRSTMQFLQRVKGCVLMAAARRSIPTESYPPRSWQATLNLPTLPYDPTDPNRKKKMVREAVRRMGANVSTFDEADSWGLCFHALHGKPGQARKQADLFEKAMAAMR